MNWENYKGYIDHIKPISKFNLLDAKDRNTCFNHKNLQPLWANENLKKSNNILNKNVTTARPTQLYF